MSAPSVPSAADSVLPVENSVLPVVEVVGLGPAGPELTTLHTTRLIDEIPRRYVRTLRHPAAAGLTEVESCDDLYESAERLEDVYDGIVDRLAAAAERWGRVIYAVPGSPCVAERSVRLLQDDPRVEARVHSAMSFAELAWARLGVDPLEAGVRLVDGRRFAVEAAGERGPFLAAQCDSPVWLSEIGDALPSPGADVWILHHLGLESERVEKVRGADLLRFDGADHLTSVFVPRLAEPVAAGFVRFSELVHTLRERCPWDREQTHKSLRRHLLEETYEVLEAIDGLPDQAGAFPLAGSAPAEGGAAEGGAAGCGYGSGYGYEDLEEELGDLLFHVFFHARMAAEAGQFTIVDVVKSVETKLRNRHPHVFGDVVAGNSEEVRANWERIKRDEKGRNSAMEGIPDALPALLFALKVQKRAEAFGVKPEPKAGASDAAAAAAPAEAVAGEGVSAARRIREFLDEDSERWGEEWLGGLLYEAVELARCRSLDPESALRLAAKKAQSEFSAAEGSAEGR